jgi:hypothetical protein
MDIPMPPDDPTVATWRILSPDEIADIENRANFHPAEDDLTRLRHEELRAAIKEVMYEVASLTPKGREQSLSLTALEEAMFWGNAAIARTDVNGVRL